MAEYTTKKNLKKSIIKTLANPNEIHELVADKTENLEEKKFYAYNNLLDELGIKRV